MNEHPTSAAITDFPLIWRWTSPTHAQFSSAELSGLHPVRPTEVMRIHDALRSLVGRDSLVPQHFSSVIVHSADIPVAEGCSWLRAQSPDPAQHVTVAWDRETALRTSWEFFTAHWDDFCYPMSDDVLIFPENQRWLLFYHHEESFHFGHVNA